ncbi:MAG: glucosamine-6-phosphate deaminase [Prevotella sp.]|nr:glucosamine-6-phosphate deaminase [Staphylococcus sp.]MCM1350961.1 glucosamine-6-phosphate deaminase [Prevotella sp.]
MKVIVVKDYQAMSDLGAEIIANTIKTNPACTLGLATGSSPIGTYQNLVKAYENKEISFKDVKTYNLDEYCGISQNHPQSYYYFMHDNLFNHVDVCEENVHIPAVSNDNLDEDCKKYNSMLHEANIDLQLLGIGGNGHIGFNEPGTPFTQETFIVELTEKTRQDNKRFFQSIEEVPTHAITMGIQNIMQAKKILMLISGMSKADTVVKLLSGEITPDFPASILHNHPDVTVIIDQDAYSKM